MRLVIRVLILAISLSIGSRLSLDTDTSKLWFNNLAQASASVDDERVMQAVIDALIHAQPLATEADAQIGGRIVFLSVSDGQTEAKVFLGRGKSLFAAARDAVSKVDRSEVPPIWVKLDIVDTVHAIGVHDLSQPLAEDRSLYGLAFSRALGVAFLPDELVAYTLVNSEQMVQLRNINRYLAEQSTAAIETVDAIELYRFTTRSYFSDGAQILSMYRGHRMVEAVDGTAMREAAVAGGEYLIRAVGHDGRFIYSYLPKTDEIKDEYNILRHAGTLYSMLELYEITGDRSLLTAARRAMGYLTKQVQPCMAIVSRVRAACVVEEDETKLGGNALAVIALVEYIAVTGEDEYLPLAVSLAEWMIGSRYADGRFVHKIRFSTEELSSFESQYYPGEAIFALARLNSIHPDERWRDAAEAAALYLITVRDANKRTSQLSHDHWLLYGLDELHRVHPDERFLLHSARIVDAIIDSQHRENVEKDWIGGYYVPPRSTPTATRSEGLCAAFKLQRDYGDATQLPRMWDALELGLRFQLQTQFQPESALYIRQPQRVLGGFRHSLTDFEVRIDYVQHNISSFVCAHEILSGMALDGQQDETVLHAFEMSAVR